MKLLYFGQSENSKLVRNVKIFSFHLFLSPKQTSEFFVLRQNWTKVEWLDEPEMEIYKK